MRDGKHASCWILCNCILNNFGCRFCHCYPEHERVHQEITRVNWTKRSLPAGWQVMVTMADVPIATGLSRTQLENQKMAAAICIKGKTALHIKRHSQQQRQQHPFNPIENNRTTMRIMPTMPKPKLKNQLTLMMSMLWNWMTAMMEVTMIMRSWNVMTKPRPISHAFCWHSKKRTSIWKVCQRWNWTKSSNPVEAFACFFHKCTARSNFGFNWMTIWRRSIHLWIVWSMCDVWGN